MLEGAGRAAGREWNGSLFHSYLRGDSGLGRGTSADSLMQWFPISLYLLFGYGGGVRTGSRREMIMMKRFSVPLLSFPARGNNAGGPN